MITFLCFWLVGWWLLACSLVCWNTAIGILEKCFWLVVCCLLAFLLAIVFHLISFLPFFLFRHGYWAEDSASARYPYLRVA